MNEFAGDISREVRLTRQIDEYWRRDKKGDFLCVFQNFFFSKIRFVAVLVHEIFYTIFSDQRLLSCSHFLSISLESADVNKHDKRETFCFDTAENEPAKNLQNFRKMHLT